MPDFSQRSLDRLASCDAQLQALFHTVIQHMDCTVLEGHRQQERQDAAFARGQSKVRWPNSKHNILPSRAIDVAPWPIDWEDRERFHLFGGLVLGIARQRAIGLRWGGDWDSDFQVKDNRFDDLVHFELKD